MRKLAFGGAAAFLAAVTASCATPPSGSDAAAQAQAKPPADPGCVVKGHSGISRPGDNLPIRMTVQSNHGWCFAGFDFSGTSTQGSRIVQKPDHGELRLLVRSNGTFFGYRPSPDYTGGDSFLVTMPSGYGGYDMNLAVTVTVVPRG